ncbi:MAG: hypothetical protein HZB47_14355 [Nitrosomonadales bacterium]|nr:hypothetical protein [Nitrosomonadales bacterium]
MDQGLAISYRFIFPNNREDLIVVKIDKQTMESLPEDSGTPPAWCRLDFHQCPNCPLQTANQPNCPLATRLVRLMAACQNVLSHDEVKMEVTTPERMVTKNTTAQRAVSSLMGLVMATSSCPHMAFLQPMARYHLPFATQEETIFRVVSTYLLEQYFRHKQALSVDLELEGLKNIYDRIQIVNKAMSARLRTVGAQDSAVNAVVQLDIFAKMLPYSIEDSLEEIRYLFL